MFRAAKVHNSPHISKKHANSVDINADNRKDKTFLQFKQ